MKSIRVLRGSLKLGKARIDQYFDDKYNEVIETFVKE